MRAKSLSRAQASIFLLTYSKFRAYNDAAIVHIYAVTLCMSAIAWLRNDLRDGHIIAVKYNPRQVWTNLSPSLSFSQQQQPGDCTEWRDETVCIYTHTRELYLALLYRSGQVLLWIQVHGYLIAITDSTTAASLNRSRFASITFVRASRSISSRIPNLLSFWDSLFYWCSLSSQNIQIRLYVLIVACIYILPVIERVSVGKLIGLDWTILYKQKDVFRMFLTMFIKYFW